MFDALTLDQLRVFVAIADSGSFRAAARSLGRAQSGLSSAIANLEAELRLTLFDRSHHRPALTEAGTTLLADARTLLIKADALRARASSFSRGIEAALTVAIDPLLPLPCLGPLAARFGREFPGVRLALATAPMTMAVTIVLDGRCDLGFTTAKEPDPHIACEAVGAVAGFVAVCQADHGLAAGVQREAGASPQWNTVDLADHVQVVVADPSDRSRGRDFGVLSQRTLRVGDLATKHALILAGAGWGNLPYWMVEADLAAGRLVQVPLAERRGPAPDPLEVYAIRRIDRECGPAAIALRQMMRENLS